MSTEVRCQFISFRCATSSKPEVVAIPLLCTRGGVLRAWCALRCILCIGLALGYQTVGSRIRTPHTLHKTLFPSSGLKLIPMHLCSTILAPVGVFFRKRRPCTYINSPWGNTFRAHRDRWAPHHRNPACLPRRCHRTAST